MTRDEILNMCCQHIDYVVGVRNPASPRIQSVHDLQERELAAIEFMYEHRLLRATFSVSSEDSSLYVVNIWKEDIGELLRTYAMAPHSKCVNPEETWGVVFTSLLHKRWLRKTFLRYSKEGIW